MRCIMAARERVTDYQHFDKYSNKVIDILRQRTDAGESVDVQDLFARFTLDAAGTSCTISRSLRHLIKTWSQASSSSELQSLIRLKLPYLARGKPNWVPLVALPRVTMVASSKPLRESNWRRKFFHLQCFNSNSNSQSIVVVEWYTARYGLSLR